MLARLPPISVPAMMMPTLPVEIDGMEYGSVDTRSWKKLARSSLVSAFTGVHTHEARPSRDSWPTLALLLSSEPSPATAAACRPNGASRCRALARTITECCVPIRASSPNTPASVSSVRGIMMFCRDCTSALAAAHCKVEAGDLQLAVVRKGFVIRLTPGVLLSIFSALAKKNSRRGMIGPPRLAPITFFDPRNVGAIGILVQRLQRLVPRKAVRRPVESAGPALGRRVDHSSVGRFRVQRLGCDLHLHRLQRLGGNPLALSPLLE